jgi:hypothetical protein
LLPTDKESALADVADALTMKTADAEAADVAEIETDALDTLTEAHADEDETAIDAEACVTLWAESDADAATVTVADASRA